MRFTSLALGVNKGRFCSLSVSSPFSFFFIPFHKTDLSRPWFTLALCSCREQKSLFSAFLLRPSSSSFIATSPVLPHSAFLIPFIHISHSLFFFFFIRFCFHTDISHSLLTTSTRNTYLANVHDAVKSLAYPFSSNSSILILTHFARVQLGNPPKTNSIDPFFCLPFPSLLPTDPYLFS